MRILMAHACQVRRLTAFMFVYPEAPNILSVVRSLLALPGPLLTASALQEIERAQVPYSGAERQSSGPVPSFGLQHNTPSLGSLGSFAPLNIRALLTSNGLGYPDEPNGLAGNSFDLPLSIGSEGQNGASSLVALSSMLQGPSYASSSDLQAAPTTIIC